MNIRIPRQWLALLLAGALLGACAGQKEPAQKAIDTAEAAIAAIRQDAATYVPDDLKGLEESLAGMKSNFAKGNYPAVLSASRELNTRIAAVSSAVAAQKTENEVQTAQLTEQWNTLSVEVPEMVEAVTARVDSLTKSGKLPKDVDAATFERVKTDAATMAQSWQQALGAFSNGNMQEAVDMAQVAKEKAGVVMLTLKMS
jgi:hypothetical protein